MPAWTAFRDAAQFERQRAEQASLRATVAAKNAGTAPWRMHDEATIDQMRNAMAFGTSSAAYWPRTDTLDMLIG
jgi:hypothetical protein